MFFDVYELTVLLGHLGVVAVVFAESGLFFGFFLPGDSLIVSAGLLAQQGHLNFKLLTFALPIAAIVGDSVGYWFGKKYGVRFIKEKYLGRSRKFYAKYGSRTIVIARFVPIIRTFAPIIAGASDMNYRTFVIYNVIGGILWANGMLFIGFFLGEAIPNVERYLAPVIVVVIILSLVPIFIERRRL